MNYGMSDENLSGIFDDVLKKGVESAKKEVAKGLATNILSSVGIKAKVVSPGVSVNPPTLPPSVEIVSAPTGGAYAPTRPEKSAMENIAPYLPWIAGGLAVIVILPMVLPRRS